MAPLDKDLMRSAQRDLRGMGIGNAGQSVALSSRQRRTLARCLAQGLSDAEAMHRALQRPPAQGSAPSAEHLELAASGQPLDIVLLERGDAEMAQW